MKLLPVPSEEVMKGVVAGVMSPTMIFDELVAESLRMGLPVHYKDDLYIHDKTELTTLGENPRFLWVLRQCGTFLVQLDRLPLGCTFPELIQAFAGSDREWYIFEDNWLRPITFYQAMDIARVAQEKLGHHS